MIAEVKLQLLEFHEFGLICFLLFFSDTLEDSVEHRSVMSGGTVRGWLPDVSVVLWRRVLGLLGDPNDVSSPYIHEQIFKYLLELTETLVKVREPICKT